MRSAQDGVVVSASWLGIGLPDPLERRCPCQLITLSFSVIEPPITGAPRARLLYDVFSLEDLQALKRSRYSSKCRRREPPFLAPVASFSCPVVRWKSRTDLVVRAGT